MYRVLTGRSMASHECLYRSFDGLSRGGLIPSVGARLILYIHHPSITDELPSIHRSITSCTQLHKKNLQTQQEDQQRQSIISICVLHASRLPAPFFSCFPHTTCYTVTIAPKCRLQKYRPQGIFRFKKETPPALCLP